MSPIRILVVDDYEPCRRLVASILAKEPRVQIIGEAIDGVEAVQKVKELKPDLILLDIGLPRLNGMDAARQIRRLSPESKILILSQESSADVVREALNMGTRGYVLKAHAGAELLAAVEAVSRGDQFLSSDLGRNPSEARQAEARQSEMRASEVRNQVYSRK